MTVAPITFFERPDFRAVSLTHFFVDFLNSGRNVLMALLAISLGLSNAQLGLVLLIYNVGNALSQPLFGVVADRIGARLLVVGGIGWMIGFSAVAALAPEWPALIALTIGGIGSGAFHPTGTMIASQASVVRRNRATAVFFMSGQIGLFFGPVVAGIVLDALDRPGYVALPVLALAAFAGSWRWLENRPPAPRQERATRRPEAASAALSTLGGALLVVIILSSSTVSLSALSFAPKLFTELGFAADYVGLLAGLFMLGSAAGGVVGGALADRVGGRRVIILSMLLAIWPVYAYVPAPGVGRFVLLFLAGFFIGMPHSILVLMVQSLLPRRRALASGLALGLMFFGGSLGSYGVGLAADVVGLDVALSATAALAGLATLFALLLYLPSASATPVKRATTAAESSSS